MSRVTSKPRRILFELHSDIVGGTETFTCRLIQNLDRKRFDPVVLTHRVGKLTQYLQRKGIPSIVYPYRRGEFGDAQLSDIIRSEAIDIVQSSYYMSALPRAALRAGVPHLWRLGGHPMLTLKRFPKIKQQNLLKLMALLANRIVCPSDFIANALKNAGIDNVEVIKNGVPLDGGVPVCQGYPDQLDRVFTIGMIGHFHPQKRHVDFLRAAQSVAGVSSNNKFVLFGQNCPRSEMREFKGYQTSLKRFVAEHKLDRLVTFSRYRGDSQSILSNLHLLALPGVHEGASNSILEAMAAGVPVVAADSGGNREMIKSGITGLLVPAEDPKALANAFLMLKSDEKLRNRIIRNARKQVELHHGMIGCAENYHRVYSDLLK